MEVIAIVALVSMITGILGGPIASEPDQTQNEDLRRIRLLQQFVDRYTIQPSDVERLAAIEEYKMKCRMNGGVDAENAAIEGVETFVNAFSQLTNETRLQLKTAAKSPHGGLDSAIKTTCNWALITTSWIGNFKHSVGQCWCPEEHASFNLVQNITSSVLQYVCQNNGSGISTFVATGGEDCLTSSIPEIKLCLRTSCSRDTLNIEYEKGLPNLQLDFPIVTLKPQFCSEFQTFQKCVVGVLKRCQNPTPANQIDGLFDVVKRSYGCENFIETQI